jgi:hypothetical protein
LVCAGRPSSFSTWTVVSHVAAKLGFVQQIDQWHDQLAKPDHPAGGRCARQIDADARQNSLDAVQRQSVNELHRGDVGEQTRRCIALGDRLRRQRSHDDRARFGLGLSPRRLGAGDRRTRRVGRWRGVLALNANLALSANRVLGENAIAYLASTVFEAHVLDHLRLCRNDVVLFTDSLADARPRMPAAARAHLLGFRNVMLDANAGQVIWDRSAAGLFARVFGNDDFGLGLHLRRLGRGLGLVEQVQLVGRGLLRAGAEPLVKEQLQLLFEHRDPDRQRLVLAPLSVNQRLQRRDIVGQFDVGFRGLIHALEHS